MRIRKFAISFRFDDSRTATTGGGVSELNSVTWRRLRVQKMWASKKTPSVGEFDGPVFALSARALWLAHSSWSRGDATSCTGTQGKACCA